MSTGKKTTKKLVFIGGLSFALLAGLIMVPVIILLSIAGGGAPAGCVPGGGTLSATYNGPGVAGLSQLQMSRAAAIIGEGRQVGIPDRGIVVALATASQESGFQVYANDGEGGDLESDQAGIASSLSIPHDAVGTDHGSLGVFQQQWPWWGTMQELMDPAMSAQKFYDALLQVPNWQNLPVTVAAQYVQSSAYPSAYADDQPIAEQLLATIGSNTGTSSGDRYTLENGVYVGGTPTCATPVGTMAGGGKVVFPVPQDSGYVDQHNYGGKGSHWANYHTGDDLSVACGTPVLAATNGTVIIKTRLRVVLGGQLAGPDPNRRCRLVDDLVRPHAQARRHQRRAVLRPVSRSARSATSATRPAATSTSRSTPRAAGTWRTTSTPALGSPPTWARPCPGAPAGKDPSGSAPSTGGARPTTRRTRTPANGPTASGCRTWSPRSVPPGPRSSGSRSSSHRRAGPSSGPLMGRGRSWPASAEGTHPRGRDRLSARCLEGRRGPLRLDQVRRPDDPGPAGAVHLHFRTRVDLGTQHPQPRQCRRRHGRDARHRRPHRGEAFGRLQAAEPSTPLFLAGDMNDKARFKRLFLSLAGPGWSAANPSDKQIDWIMGGPGVSFSGAVVDQSTNDRAHRYTDHPFVHATAYGSGTQPVDGLTVLSYNIKHHRADEALAQELANSGAQVIALQDTDAATVQWLAQRLGMQAAYAPLGKWQGKTLVDNALLSRYSMYDTDNTTLPVAEGDQTRGMLHAALGISRGVFVDVYATHLGGDQTVTLDQAQRAADEIDDSNCGAVLMGDMNTTPATAAHAALTEDLVDTFADGKYEPSKTTPSKDPTQRVDYLLHDKSTKVATAQVMPAGGSTHRAIRATLSISGDCE